jgi:hypothetical protein
MRRSGSPPRSSADAQSDPAIPAATIVKSPIFERMVLPHSDVGMHRQV